MRTINFFSLIFFFLLSNVASSADLCSHYFPEESPIESSDLSLSKAFPQDAKVLQRVQKEIENSRDASKFFMSEMTKISDSIKKKHAHEIIDLDWLCLGAGPQCAAASLVLGETGFKSMVLEKSSFVGKTFADKDFFINSTETENLSMHQFPGGVGSLADYTSQKYAHSSQLAAHIQAQQYASTVPVLLSTTLTQVKLIKSDSTHNGQSIFEIITDQGITIRTKNFLVGTGLGDIGTKVKDSDYVQAFEAAYKINFQKPDQMQKIMSTDTFLIALKRSTLQKEIFHLPKRLIVIGDGDGARISLEGLRSANVKIPENFKIVWIGNNFKTAEDYVASRDGGDRYIHHIVPFYKDHIISGVAGHVKSWTQNLDGSMMIKVTDKENKLTEVQGDMIIDSTGYDPIMPKILKQISSEAQLIDVLGPLSELNLEKTVLARQVKLADGTEIPLLALGAAAGALATKLELQNLPNQNSVAIYNTVSRTSAVVSNLLGIPNFKSENGVRSKRFEPLSSLEIIQEAQKERAKREIKQKIITDAFEQKRSA